MDSGNLSQADKYLLYGLLLKKKRSHTEDRKLIAIMRSSRDLDEKIEAILALGEEIGKKDPRRSRAGRRPETAGSANRTRKMGFLKMTSMILSPFRDFCDPSIKNSSLKGGRIWESGVVCQPRRRPG